MEGFTRVRFLLVPVLVSPFLLPREMAFPARFRGDKARSDHDYAVSLAIPCISNML